ncbi:phosphonoacetaldehyde hydrolase [Enterococcus faecium]|nr:phosphonoacetaldehyde hydrolase [Enterococcus faecium]
MIKTVIFDWAGTTVDFGCMAPVHAFRNAFLEKGIQLTDKEIREPMGKLKMGSYPTASFPPFCQRTMDSYLRTTTSGKRGGGIVSTI